MWDSFIDALGDYAAGDEKLWHFTGDSGNVRLVLSKPDRIRFWFYQLCFPLRSGKSFLSYTRLHNSNATGETITVSSVVRDWIMNMHQLGDDATIDTRCYLSADSYYIASESRNVLLEYDIPFSTSVKPDRFKHLVQMVQQNTGGTLETGDFRALYNDN